MFLRDAAVMVHGILNVLLFVPLFHSACYCMIFPYFGEFTRSPFFHAYSSLNLPLTVSVVCYISAWICSSGCLLISIIKLNLSGNITVLTTVIIAHFDQYRIRLTFRLKYLIRSSSVSSFFFFTSSEYYTVSSDYLFPCRRC